MANAKGKRNSEDDYKPFSSLTREQKDEIRADPLLHRNLAQLVAQHYKFLKTAKGWVVKR